VRKAAPYVLGAAGVAAGAYAMRNTNIGRNIGAKVMAAGRHITPVIKRITQR
jgi:hypothetical protein